MTTSIERIHSMASFVGSAVLDSDCEFSRVGTKNPPYVGRLVYQDCRPHVRENRSPLASVTDCASALAAMVAGAIGRPSRHSVGCCHIDSENSA
jgi:hypothetical protein